MVVVNDDVERAADELVGLLTAPSPGLRQGTWRPRVTAPFGSVDRPGLFAPAIELRSTPARVRIAPAPEGITNPPIDELLERTSSKYGLVIFAAKRARQINAYYSQLGEGLLEYVGPLVDTTPQEKPLSIALREINEGLLTHTAGEN